MKKKYRLLKNYQFEKLIVNGKFINNRDFFLYYDNNNLDTIRIGISVPKKLINKAFNRNKIKRQIKNMLVDINKDWSIDIVLIVRKNYLNNDYNTNKLSLDNILNKIPIEEKKNKPEK